MRIVSHLELLKEVEVRIWLCSILGNIPKPRQVLKSDYNFKSSRSSTGNQKVVASSYASYQTNQSTNARKPSEDRAIYVKDNSTPSFGTEEQVHILEYF